VATLPRAGAVKGGIAAERSEGTLDGAKRGSTIATATGYVLTVKAHTP
jgi:hypothetical protein